jgi:hypothetical protein
MELIFYAVVAIASLYCLVDWRRGLYLCLLIDFVRDPVRKLAEDQPLAITLAGVVPWMAVFLGALVKDRAAIQLMWSRYPKLRVMVICIMVAIVPAAAISSVGFVNGWMMAAVGSASYIVPLMGIGVGFALARSEDDVYRLLRFYALLNSVALIGTVFEKFHMAVPALGGIKVDWVRYRTGYTVELISGFYRSPDIMGLHAAHVVLFTSLLAIRARGAARMSYLTLALWATLSLFLSGRRKMVGMPLVFVVCYYFACRWRGIGRSGGKPALLACAITLAGAGFLAFNEDEQGHEYTDYALTMFTEAHERAGVNVVGAAIETMRQVGVLGAGLGTATQGRHYLGIKSDRSRRGWQEDGFSRLFMELGVPGVLLVLFAVIQLVNVTMTALKLVAPTHSVQGLQIGLLSCAAADAMSYVFSHQQYSGDPVSALLVTIMIGAILGAPRIFAADVARRRALSEAAALAAERRGVVPSVR